MAEAAGIVFERFARQRGSLDPDARRFTEAAERLGGGNETRIELFREGAVALDRGALERLLAA